MATHSGILAWRILWTEEPGGLQSTGLQRVKLDRVTNPSSFPFFFNKYDYCAVLDHSDVSDALQPIGL